MAAAVKDADPTLEVVCVPIADGGEGTIDALGAVKVPAQVVSCDGVTIDSCYGVMNGTVVIETATCCGLTLTKVMNPERTTTYGCGQLIRHALDAGHRKFIVALGGSATNDAGCGVGAALGVKFYNAHNREFVPVGGTLAEIDSIDIAGLDCRIKESQFSVMCDVDNPLYGKNGAAYVFSPQKGADLAMVERLDKGLINFADKVKTCVGIDISTLRGGGAAGGMGAGLSVFFGADLKSGVDIVLDSVRFDALLDRADLVITGEGRFDSQSLHGKAVSGVANRAKLKNVPVIVVAGAVDDTAALPKDSGIAALFSIQRAPKPFEQAAATASVDLFHTVNNLVKVMLKIY
jgi:glycerate kinase